MKTPKAPTPPDPVATAAAQTGTNIATAQANAILGNVNQITPDGTLTYTQSGQRFVSDPTGGQTYWQGPNGEIQSSAPQVQVPQQSSFMMGSGGMSSNGMAGLNVVSKGGSPTMTATGVQTLGGMQSSQPTTRNADGWTQTKGYFIPQYTAETKLSAAQQAIKDQQDAAELNLAQTANNRSAWLQDYLKTPFSLDNEKTEARLFELGRKRLDPVMEQNRASLETSLANRGIQMGSDAYKTAMTQLGQDQNDAYNSLALSGRAQAVQEALTERSQPLNELAALLGGAQVSQPNFVPTNQPTIPTTDFAGIVSSNYQQRMAGWQAQMASRNATIGALAGVAGAGLGGWLKSDRRVKENVRLIGDTGRGFNLYTFDYIGELGRHIGFMADEVERVHPEAVSEFDGVKHVNYAMLEAA